MSLTSTYQVINVRPTKVGKCRFHDLSLAHLAFNVLDIRQNTVKRDTCNPNIGYTLSGYNDMRHLKFTIDLQQWQLS